MSPDYWLWAIKELIRDVPLRRSAPRERARPYELIVRLSDESLDWFAKSHGMCTLQKDEST